MIKHCFTNIKNVQFVICSKPQMSLHSDMTAEYCPSRELYIFLLKIKVLHCYTFIPNTCLAYPMDFMARNIYLPLLKKPSNYHITKPNQRNTVLHGG